MDQPYLFPLTDLQTEGYAQPEPRQNDIEDDVDGETQAEAA
jgi:hypothetical protein